MSDFYDDHSSTSRLHTSTLTLSRQQLLARMEEEQRGYQALPRVLVDVNGAPLPHWRLHINFEGDPPTTLGVDLYGTVTLGREVKEPGLLDLNPYHAGSRGVSRRHLELRPTPDGLFAVDLNSTNGSLKNGVKLKPNSPTPVGHHDSFALGMLHFQVEIIDAPHQEAEFFEQEMSLGLALSQMAKAISTQTKVEDVLATVVDYAVGLTDADEAMLWLADTAIGELRLDASRGLDADLVTRLTLPLSGSLPGEVALTNTARRFDRPVALGQLYEARAFLCAPLTLGGLALGALGVANRTTPRLFSEQDEQVTASLADFAAIGLQNSRTLEATDEALREALKTQREATSRALESTRVKTDFMSVLSHEIRAPLHTINGFSRMGMDGDLGEASPDALDAFGRIYRNGEKLLHMVENLLESMRAEAMGMEVENVQFSPLALVSDLTESHKPRATAKGLLLNWGADSNVPHTVLGDPGKIQQVITNLVTNAIKYTDAGEVNVQISMVGSYMWTVSVADTGLGIPVEELDNVFERFHQIEGQQSEGVGLGLAIANDLVQAMGGVINVTSDGVGKGATFTMTLPVTLPEQPTDMDEDATMSPLSGT